MKEVFKEFSKNILIFLAKEVKIDPHTEAVRQVYLSPFPIKAVVTDLIASQTIWKIPGIETSKAKELMIEKRHKELIEQSQKVEIDGDTYYGWRDSAGKNVQLREEGDFIRVIVYTK